MEPKDKKNDLKTKHRNAAFKAWKTIRKDKLTTAAKELRLIEEFVLPKKVTQIRHPELNKITFESFPTSFGNRIVSLFHKTPPEIACGKFWELRWAFGCPLDCNYCYLRGTMKGKMKPSIIKIHYVLSAIEEAFASLKQPTIFNSGELCDSLMNPSIMEQIADKFEQQKKHKLLLLSKFGPNNISFLVSKLRKQVICTWSLNSEEVAKKWELSAPSPKLRIEAAKMVSEIGIDTRIRIDPIFPIEGWKKHYQNLIHTLFDNLSPSHIILGTPRGLWKTIEYAKQANVDMSWTQFFSEDSGWGKKLNFDKRKEIYTFFYDLLDSIGYDLKKVTMCKESVSMWKILGIPYESLTCNCYGEKAFS